jgi:hypothetical protein
MMRVPSLRVWINSFPAPVSVHISKNFIEGFGKFGLKKRVNFGAQDFLARPAVKALCTTVPTCYAVLRIAKDDCIETSIQHTEILGRCCGRDTQPMDQSNADAAADDKRGEYDCAVGPNREGVIRR